MPDPDRPVPGSPISDEDLYLFHEGTQFRAWEKLGAHRGRRDGEEGVWFAVWAPAARRVAVVGSFNGWDRRATEMVRRSDGGVWEAFVGGVPDGALYKFHVESRFGGYAVDKTDPYGVAQELPPATASRLASLEHDWADADWCAGRAERHAPDAPISVYEAHLGSWRRADGRRHLTYLELADELVPYVADLGFTHVQLLPVLEHPFYGSWGYGATGYFAATSRYGAPADLMALIDRFHAAGIGVLLDWVPAHFPYDEAALGFFDGTWAYEHADPRKGHHPDWNSKIFNYGRPEVRSFLISSARFWLEVFHADGLRVDAVASMLYLDYSRDDGAWVPNEFGGRENLEAIDFLRRLNDAVRERCPGRLMVAEESTAWPGVTKPTADGGLGFDLKWDMGWMHDSLQAFQADPLFRKGCHDALTFRQIYSDAERFMLPLSHDEVVHGKRSLLDKMPGDVWQKVANLRLLFAWMFAQNGKKLLFMGGEFAQWREWDHEAALDWALLDDPRHAGVKRLVAALNRLYRERPAMHALDAAREGFEWIDCSDARRSVLSLLRLDGDGGAVAAVFNLTPVPRDDERIGLPWGGTWTVRVDTDAEEFGGSGYADVASVEAEEVERHGRPWSATLPLPPLGALFLEGPPAPRDA
ncbi:MAG: 1,4-alpha-glucan branching protein GlgB [Planctomycetota bacterium JB042]